MMNFLQWEKQVREILNVLDVFEIQTNNRMEEEDEGEEENETSQYSYRSFSHSSFEYPSNYKNLTQEQRKVYQDEYKKKMQ